MRQDVPLIFVVFSTYASCGERNLNPSCKTFSSDKFGKRFHHTKGKTEKVGIDDLYTTHPTAAASLGAILNVLSIRPHLQPKQSKYIIKTLIWVRTREIMRIYVPSGCVPSSSSCTIKWWVGSVTTCSYGFIVREYLATPRFIILLNCQCNNHISPESRVSAKAPWPWFLCIDDESKHRFRTHNLPAHATLLLVQYEVSY